MFLQILAPRVSYIKQKESAVDNIAYRKVLWSQAMEQAKRQRRSADLLLFGCSFVSAVATERRKGKAKGGYFGKLITN